jgi:exopolyphosphatase/pppGpp-phosphohydrolase
LPVEWKIGFRIKEHAMPGETWTEREKKIARRVFDAALQRELAEVMAEFKSRAASAKVPDDMWSVEEYLSQARREIDRKYDYRYSQLEFVFGRLLREKRIEEPELQGLSEERLVYIRRVASL